MEDDVDLVKTTGEPAEGVAAAMALSAGTDDWELIEFGIKEVDEDVLEFQFAIRNSDGSRLGTLTPLLCTAASEFYRQSRNDPRTRWVSAQLTLASDGEFVVLFDHPPLR